MATQSVFGKVVIEFSAPVKDAMKDMKELSKQLKDLNKINKDFGKDNKNVFDKSISQLKVWEVTAVKAFKSFWQAIIQASPSIQAHLSIIGLLMRLIAMDIGSRVTWAFVLLTKAVILFYRWWKELPEGFKDFLSNSALLVSTLGLLYLAFSAISKVLAFFGIGAAATGLAETGAAAAGATGAVEGLGAAGAAAGTAIGGIALPEILIGGATLLAIKGIVDAFHDWTVKTKETGSTNDKVTNDIIRDLERTNFISKKVSTDMVTAATKSSADIQFEYLDAFKEIDSGVKSTGATITSTIEETNSTVSASIATESRNWGVDLVQGIIDGIKSWGNNWLFDMTSIGQALRIIDTVKGVYNSFSTASGILGNKYDTVPSSSKSSTSTNSSSYTTNTSFTINSGYGGKPDSYGMVNQLTAMMSNIMKKPMSSTSQYP